MSSSVLFLDALSPAPRPQSGAPVAAELTADERRALAATDRALRGRRLTLSVRTRAGTLWLAAAVDRVTFARGGAGLPRLVVVATVQADDPRVDHTVPAGPQPYLLDDPLRSKCPPLALLADLRRVADGGGALAVREAAGRACPACRRPCATPCCAACGARVYLPAGPCAPDAHAPRDPVPMAAASGGAHCPRCGELRDPEAAAGPTGGRCRDLG